MNFDRNKVEMVKKQYPVGTRIRLNSLCNDERDDALNIALRANWACVVLWSVWTTSRACS